MLKITCPVCKVSVFVADTTNPAMSAAHARSRASFELLHQHCELPPLIEITPPVVLTQCKTGRHNHLLSFYPQNTSRDVQPEVREN